MNHPRAGIESSVFSPNALIRELADYVGFTEVDQTRLTSAQPHFKPMFPELVDRFYESVQSNASADRFLKNSGVPIERLKGTLLIWAEEFFTHPRNDAYAQRRLNIGYRHVQLGLQQKYVLGAMNVVRSFLLRHALPLCRGDFETSAGLLETLNRALDLDMNLICEAYFARSIEEQQVERGIVETRLADFLERSNLLVVGLDLLGRITQFNATFERSSGRNRSDVLGRPFGEFFLPERTRDTVMPRILSVSETLNLEPFETVLRTKDDRELLIRWYPTLVRNRGGDVAEIVGLGHDITELVLLQRQGAEREKMAALGVLAAGIAHEIGNPLNSMLAVTQSLQRRLKDGPGSEDLRLLANEVSRAARLLHQMTQMARPQRRRHEEIDLNTVVSSTLELVRFDRRTRRIQINVQLDSTLPKLLANSDELSQLLLNLMLNSLDAMEQEGGTLAIRTFMDDGRITIEVKDTGCGIPEDMQAQLFNPFFTTKPAGRGTGLGLWVCRRIAQDHGGAISLASQPGVGTTITIALPVRQKP